MSGLPNVVRTTIVRVAGFSIRVHDLDDGQRVVAKEDMEAILRYLEGAGDPAAVLSAVRSELEQAIRERQA